MKEHFDRWENESEDSVLHRHGNQCHDGGTFEVGVKVLASCYGKPTNRLITEAVTIEDIPEENSMNERSEWNYVRIPHIAVV